MSQKRKNQRATLVYVQFREHNNTKSTALNIIFII